MCFKSETTLADLPPTEVVHILRSHRPPLLATPREFILVGRLPATLTLEEVEGAYSNPRDRAQITSTTIRAAMKRGSHSEGGPYGARNDVSWR